MKKRKINIVDIAVIFVIVGLIAGAIYKFGIVNNEHEIASDTIENREYVIYVEGVRQPTIEGVHVGDKFYDDTTGTFMGKVVNIEVKPYTTMILTNDGEYKKAEKIGYKTLYITLEGPVLEKSDGYFANGIIELKRNSNIILYSKFVQTTFKIFDIKDKSLE